MSWWMDDLETLVCLLLLLQVSVDRGQIRRIIGVGDVLNEGRTTLVHLGLFCNLREGVNVHKRELVSRAIQLLTQFQRGWNVLCEELAIRAGCVRCSNADFLCACKMMSQHRIR